MKYKKIKKLVPYCEYCKSEIHGDGNMIRPYNCKCGLWEYDTKKNDYMLVKLVIEEVRDIPLKPLTSENFQISKKNINKKNLKQ